jgi:hypothetical protein
LVGVKPDTGFVADQVTLLVPTLALKADGGKQGTTDKLISSKLKYQGIGAYTEDTPMLYVPLVAGVKYPSSKAYAVLAELSTRAPGMGNIPAVLWLGP